MRRLPLLTAVLLGLSLFAAPASAAPLTGEADDDAIVVVNGDVVVKPGEISKGVFIVDGNTRVAGRVDGDVVLIAGDARIGGRIDGDLVTVAGRARLLPTARVGGDLIYADERPRIAPAAKVEGEVEKAGWKDSVGLLSFIGAFAFWLAISISAAVLGLLLLAISPRAADATLAQAKLRFWTAVGIGAGIFIALPVASLIAAITLVGLPLAIGLGLVLLPLAAVAYSAAAWVLGRTIVKPPGNRILSFLAGLGILRAVALVPVLGAFAWLGAVIVGLGLIGAAIATARTEPAR